jgi:hypothetical protein
MVPAGYATQPADGPNQTEEEKRPEDLERFLQKIVVFHTYL